jgi:ADP-ribosyl-[dinitrogen reductase] hydrolase
MKSRFRGAILGLACGDAVGTTLEFRRPGSFEHLTDMVGGGPFNLQPGEWTDDTSMALCLAESLVECGGFDPLDQMSRYTRWLKEGYLSSTGTCFDIGLTTRRALQTFASRGNPYAGTTDESSAGNGSLMRLAPVVLFYHTDPLLASRMAVDSSRTTHGAATAIDACRYFSWLLIGALRGESKETLLSEGYCPDPRLREESQLHPEISEVASGSFRQREPPVIKGSGFVVRSLEAALWAFHRSETFEQGCLMAANLGDDADTTAAIFGQIAGAYYTEEGIPPRWLARLAMRDRIESLADALLSRSAEASAVDISG